MSKATNGTGLCILGLAAITALCFPTGAAQEPKGNEKAEDTLSSIVGTWDNEVRHAVHASLYQQEHGARLRESLIRFKQDGMDVVGFSLVPDHTPFRGVRFAKGRLAFEFDIDALKHGWGQRTTSKAWVSVEAELKSDRLIGKWRMFEKESGDEVFRGEWEAVRAKEQAVGAVVLAGGGDLPKAARDEFFELAGGKGKAQIVVIPTARSQDSYTGKEDGVLEPWEAHGPAWVRLLHTRDRETANDPSFIEPLTKATAVWFTNGHTDRLLNAYQGTKVEAELKRLLERGGVVGGMDAGAAVLADRVIQRFDPDVLSPGYGLLPGILTARGFGEETDKTALDMNASYAGLGIPNDTGVIVRGRSMQVVGTGPVSVYRAKSSGTAARQVVVPAGTKYDLNEATESK